MKSELPKKYSVKNISNYKLQKVNKQALHSNCNWTCNFVEEWRQNIIIPNLFKRTNNNYKDNDDDNINIFNQGKPVSYIKAVIEGCPGELETELG